MKTCLAFVLGLITFFTVAQNSPGYFYKIKLKDPEGTNFSSKLDPKQAIKNCIADAEDIRSEEPGAYSFTSYAEVVPFEFASTLEQKGILVETIERKSIAQKNGVSQKGKPDEGSYFFYYKTSGRSNLSRKAP